MLSWDKVLSTSSRNQHLREGMAIHDRPLVRDPRSQTQFLARLHLFLDVAPSNMVCPPFAPQCTLDTSFDEAHVLKPYAAFVLPCGNFDAHRGLAILAQAQGFCCSRAGIRFRVFLFCSAPGKTTFHASQGLASSVAGWVQVLRGPRPPSEKWPSAKDACRVHQSGNTPQSPPPARQPSNPPEAAAANASAEVQWLETAISAVGETSPHAKPLMEAMRIARAKSAVPPLQQRIHSCKLFAPSSVLSQQRQ